jgi:hypothetical protein
MEADQKKEMVLIKWHDAKFYSGTYNERAILEQHRMALFESLGYLVGSNGYTTFLAAECNDQAEYRDITLIPTGSIISITKLTASSFV